MQPLVFLCSRPAQCSQLVQVMVQLVQPLNFAGDYRPYFTIHDSDLPAITAPPPPLPPGPGALAPADAKNSHSTGSNKYNTLRYNILVLFVYHFILYLYSYSYSIRILSSHYRGSVVTDTVLFDRYTVQIYSCIVLTVLCVHSLPHSVILGVTNPFFAKMLQNWPHIIRLDDSPICTLL